YGCYLFAHKAGPLLADFMKTIDTTAIGKGLERKDTGCDNLRLIQVNQAIRGTCVEKVGKTLRTYMSAMKPRL
ncbi:MAG: ketol-acid reductoisomerase, partial [Proteobacteria bacterium]|nr:ketol-acid reductoisomerase [Pseudomonadota bacterium]